MTTLSNINKQQYERIPSIGENSETNSHNLHKEEEKGTAFVYYLVFCVCIGGFLFGYDTGGFYIDITIQFDSFTHKNNSYIWSITAITKGLCNVHSREGMDRRRYNIGCNFWWILRWIGTITKSAQVIACP